MPCVLLIDVAHPYAAELRAAASTSELEVVSAEGDAIAFESRDLVLCVIRLLPRSPGSWDRVRGLRKFLRGVPLVVMGEGFGVDDVVRLMRIGAADVVGLPAQPRAVAARALSRASHPTAGGELRAIVGESPAIRALRREVGTVAATRSTVLLTGETGTGKGLVARVIHDLSRGEGPFVHVDCASLAPSVIESELFGHERGAFTGAVERRSGRFELASGGTIFLDEIGDLAPELQAKLLRVLQDRRFERIGGVRTLTMDARVMAATNCDLKQAIREHRFRADLYFRLAVFELRIPPLRDRRADLPFLVRAGLEGLADRLGMPCPEVGESFERALARHSWPGNVRELWNLLERLVLSVGGERLDEGDLEGLLAEGRTDGPPGPSGSGSSRGPPGGTVGERDAIARILCETGGNVSRTARRLGMSRGSLRYWIRKLGLEHLVPAD